MPWDEKLAGLYQNELRHPVRVVLQVPDEQDGFPLLLDRKNRQHVPKRLAGGAVVDELDFARLPLGELLPHDLQGFLACVLALVYVRAFVPALLQRPTTHVLPRLGHVQNWKPFPDPGYDHALLLVHAELAAETGKFLNLFFLNDVHSVCPSITVTIYKVRPVAVTRLQLLLGQPLLSLAAGVGAVGSWGRALPALVRSGRGQTTHSCVR